MDDSNSLKKELSEFGLTFHYECILEKHPEKAHHLNYDFKALIKHEEFKDDVIETHLEAEIETEKTDYKLLSIEQTGMYRVKVKYKARGVIAGKVLELEEQGEGHNSSMLWALGSSKIGDDLIKPHARVEKSLAMSVKQRILKLAKGLGVEHPKKEDPAPSPPPAPVVEEVKEEPEKQPQQVESEILEEATYISSKVDDRVTSEFPFLRKQFSEN